MSDISIVASPLRTLSYHSVHNEDKTTEQKGFISNMTRVFNAEAGCELKLRSSIDQEITEHTPTELVNQYEIRSIYFMNENINRIYWKLPEGVAREEKYLGMLKAQKNVLSNWKQDIQEKLSPLEIKMIEITSKINKINMKMGIANAEEKQELLTKKERLLSEKKSLLRSNTSSQTLLSNIKVSNLNMINNELIGVNKDIEAQSLHLDHLKSSS